jgi:hypothetical protein
MSKNAFTGKRQNGEQAGQRGAHPRKIHDLLIEHGADKAKGPEALWDPIRTLVLDSRKWRTTRPPTKPVPPNTVALLIL